MKVAYIVTHKGTGGAYAYAAISITYPSGSTCTATNGTVTLTAPDTTGSWLCIVPSGGEWTLTISNSSHSPISKTVQVVQNRLTEIELTYFDGKLYNHGYEYPKTGGWTKDWYSYEGYDNGGTLARNTDNLRLTRNAGDIPVVGINNAVDATGFTTLTLIYISSVNATLFVSTNKAITSSNTIATASLPRATSTNTVSVPISGDVSDVYVSIALTVGNGYVAMYDARFT